MSDPNSVPETPNIPSTMGDVFTGPNGLRAGWRLLIFLALVAAMFLALGAFQRQLLSLMGTAFSARNVLLQDTITFSVIAIATAIMGKFERRRFADYGLPGRDFLGKQFWTGARWGFVMLSFIVAMMTAAHAYTAAGWALAPAKLLIDGLLWALAFLVVGLFEEFSFRGYMLFTLTTGIGFWPAAVITCVLFAGAHIANPGENWIGVVEIVLIAIFLCLALRRTGNLWFAIGWHMAFDWGESFFYSTPNSGIQATGHMLKASLKGSKWLSGGSVGPEASVFDLIVTVAGILLLLKLYPDAKYPQASAFVPSAAVDHPVVLPSAPS